MNISQKHCEIVVFLKKLSRPPIFYEILPVYIKVKGKSNLCIGSVQSQTLDRQTLDATNPREANTRHDKP